MYSNTEKLSDIECGELLSMLHNVNTYPFDSDEQISGIGSGFRPNINILGEFTTYEEIFKDYRALDVFATTRLTLKEYQDLNSEERALINKGCVENIKIKNERNNTVLEELNIGDGGEG